jgi:REP element-mobilizing transposase RayT
VKPMTIPKRKRIRLRNYDYSQNGAYIITICTKDKKCILSRIAPEPVEIPIGHPPRVILTDYGKIVEEAILGVSNHYKNVSIDKYVIMPNHVHLLLIIDSESGRPMGVPTVSSIINQFKGFVTKSVGFPLWQNSFYDHVIRDEDDFLTKYRYIDTNPANWLDDEYNT